MRPPRVVLDTNCLVSALIFSRGRYSWLREAWKTERFVALVSQDTLAELLRVLAYPKFELTGNEQETLLAEFLPYIEVVKTGAMQEILPEIRDKDDIKFLVLASVGKADALVSGDKDLHAIKALFPVPILSLSEFADWL